MFPAAQARSFGQVVAVMSGSVRFKCLAGQAIMSNDVIIRTMRIYQHQIKEHNDASTRRKRIKMRECLFGQPSKVMTRRSPTTPQVLTPAPPHPASSPASFLIAPTDR
jgi:hypothetical protein